MKNLSADARSLAPTRLCKQRLRSANREPKESESAPIIPVTYDSVSGVQRSIIAIVGDKK
jgi:hypothetical protein